MIARGFAKILLLSTLEKTWRVGEVDLHPLSMRDWGIFEVEINEAQG
jgi:hypothetical protein